MQHDTRDAKLVLERSLQDACRTEYRLETNGYHGGDAGHGAYLKLTIKQDGCDMGVSVGGRETKMVEDITITLFGDAEIRNFITMVGEISSFLERYIGNVGRNIRFF